MNITLQGKSDTDDWPRSNLGFPPDMPLTTPPKGKMIREQASKANMPLALHPPPPEKRDVPRKRTAFPAESVDLLLDLTPSTTQEQSRENGNRYMKDLELLIPIHNTSLRRDAPDAMDHPISLCSNANQVLLKPPANVFDSGGGEFNRESDLIDITPESAALSSSISICSPRLIENTMQKNSKNLGKFEEEARDDDGSDTGEIESTFEPIREPKKWNKRMSKRRLERRGDFSKW